MPIFVAALLGGLVQIAGSLVGRVLLSLGLGFVTYSGVSASLDYFRGLFVQYSQGSGATVAGLLGVLQVDVALGILIAAVTARLVLDGLNSGTVKKLVGK